MEITYYTDPLCCRSWEMEPAWSQLQDEYGGQLGITYKMAGSVSSFSACIAVKCVELQDEDLGALYLRLLREAVMVQNLNVARASVLHGVARVLSRLSPNFDLCTFRADLLGLRGRVAFRGDCQEVQYTGIRRLPTVVFRGGNKVRILTGSQTLEALRSAVKEVTC
jgi:predicted DsbA family dithiol-disulfide isomerase